MHIGKYHARLSVPSRRSATTTTHPFLVPNDLTPATIYLLMYHSVSLENAATYDKDRHLRANFNDVSTKTKSFLTRLQSAWPGKKFQEIILDCKIETLLLHIIYLV